MYAIILAKIYISAKCLVISMVLALKPLLIVDATAMEQVKLKYTPQNFGYEFESNLKE